MRDANYASHFVERLGFLPRSCRRTAYGSIWLHAVSVGEVASARPLLEELKRSYPNRALFVSIGTVAGRRTAAKQLGELADCVFYVPLDYVSLIRRVLKTIRPALVIVAETEIWPNLYAETKRSGASLAIVNGRISNRTWPTYKRFRWFFGPVLKLADLVAVPSETDFERYRAMGVPTERLQLPGNLKYDAASSTKATAVDIPTFGAEQVWVAASTVGPVGRRKRTLAHLDEDDLVLNVFRRLSQEFPKLLLILAPRQPSRFATVERKLERLGLPFVRRSEMNAEAPSQLSLPGVVLLDTIGELAGVFCLANVAFVGGSIAPRGGHNVLEPATAGVPVIVGKHTYNFESIITDFKAAEAIAEVANAEELFAIVSNLLKDVEEAHALGVRGQQLAAQKRGAAGKVVELLQPLMASAFRPPLQNVVGRALLWPIALAWESGGRVKRTRSLRWANDQSPLGVPVLSVGGLTVGGSGKTPMTQYLMSGLKQRGFKPAILTRGYGRRSPAEYVIVGPGKMVSAALTGDEAQILIRSAGAPVGIGANRYQTGQRVLAKHPETDVMVLDDGFQHARILRELDVVVIDGLDPLGGGEVVPLGRLREPLHALVRADVFVVTRADDDNLYKVIQDRLRRWNGAAPVFRVRLAQQTWRDSSDGEGLIELGTRRVGAFCALGNPQNFWNTLTSLGLEVVFRWEFQDHHAYKPTELQRIAKQARFHGAELLVTTEKDRVNCPEGFEAMIKPLRLVWLEIGYEVDDDKRFWEFVEERIGVKKR